MTIEQSTGDHEDSNLPLLEEWARDFEKMEAAVYQNTTAPESIAEIEVQRLRDAVETAAAAQKLSVDALAKFLSDSGEPKLLDAFQEIRIEAATLSGA